jgi:hypothetical protein
MNPETRDAVFRSPQGVTVRRIRLIEERLPQWVEVPVRGSSAETDLYILAVADPIRPIYRWQARQPISNH